jgi:hypothetical protein
MTLTSPHRKMNDLKSNMNALDIPFIAERNTDDRR